MDDIHEWLKGNKDYDAGAKLYLMHGKEQSLRRVFSEPVSEFKKKKLVEALTALVTKKVEAAKKIEVTKQAAIEHISVSNRKWPAKKDATLTALHEKWKPLYAEMMSLMSRIYDVALAGQTDSAKKQEAGRMAHRILDLDDECDAIYEQREFYLKHNKLKEEEKPMELVTDVKKIPLALSNAQRYVRDYKNKLLKKPDDVFAAEKLKQYEWAVGVYKKQLNLD